MKKEIAIGIVEDELLIAEKIRLLLQDLGYQVLEPACNYDEAMEMIVREKPDLLLLDINLGDEKDGVDIARTVNEAHGLPFIFLTANSDRATVERAKLVRPFAYLVKPFTREELFASIEIAVNNFNTSSHQAVPSQTATDVEHFFIKDGYRFVKIVFREVTYIESRENYVVIHTLDKKQLTHRSTFSDFLSQLPVGLFCRVHRSFAVQTRLINQVDQSNVSVAGVEIPVSNSYKEALFSQLNLKG